MKSASLLNRAVLLLLLLAVLAGIYFSGRWMLADLAREEVRYSFSQWNEQGSVPDLAAWNSAGARLERALALDPRNAELHRLLGLLQEWRLYIVGDSLTTEAIIQIRQQAIAHYRDSARLRPAWPDAWAHVARQKALLRQTDADFKQAFERADTLGQWEVRIQLLLVETGTLVWNRLDETDRQRLLGVITRAFSRQPNTNRLLAQFRNQGTEVYLQNVYCPRLDTQNFTQRARQACQQND